MDIKLLMCATEMRAISFYLCMGPRRRKGESQWSTEVSLSRSSWIPEELTGMYILECVSQPHLWETHPPSLVSLIPLADIDHDWQLEELFGFCPQEPGGRYGKFWKRTNGRLEILQARRGCGEIKLISGVCPLKFVSSQTVKGHCYRTPLWLVKT